MKRDQDSLAERRRKIESLRSGSAPEQGNSPVGLDIAGSWERSRSLVSANCDAAPLDELGSDWERSPLYLAAAPCLGEFESTARDSGMVAAISDAAGKLLWTGCSRNMRSRAERVHFVPGGRWDEQSIGTNALGMVMRYRRASSVFSAEHFLPAVQDWVCYAAPITDPLTGELVGVLDLSTTWNKHSPLGLAAASGFAQRISSAFQQSTVAPALRLRMLGEPRVFMHGQPVSLTPRQVEILCLLAVHDDGLDLDRLHAALYGDRPVSSATLKTELSQLREKLGGGIGSRPYRLNVSWRADFIEVEKALNEGRLEAALLGYRGPFLARTDSPALCAWRDCLESSLTQAIFRTEDAELLLAHLRRSPEASDACERLLELLPAHDPRRELLSRWRG